MIILSVQTYQLRIVRWKTGVSKAWRIIVRRRDVILQIPCEISRLKRDKRGERLIGGKLIRDNLLINCFFLTEMQRLACLLQLINKSISTRWRNYFRADPRPQTWFSVAATVSIADNVKRVVVDVHWYRHGHNDTIMAISSMGTSHVSIQSLIQLRVIQVCKVASMLKGWTSPN